MSKVTKYLEAATEVEKFNERFPVGTDVMLCKDSGVIKTTVRGKAYVFLDSHPVAHFKGVAGCYVIGGDRVRPVTEAQEEA